MSIIRALVTIPKTDGLPENAVSNTLHFVVPTPIVQSDLAAITTDLTAFYQAVDGYLSNLLTPTATVRYYDLADAKPRQPLRTDTIALTLGASNPLPEELAICLSYQGDKISGLSQARRRGRIYLGPLSATAQGSTAATSNRPLAAAVSAIAAAGLALKNASVASGSYEWVVYSSVLDSTTAVRSGWCDNAFDTQRRRGVAATSRTTW